jgi:RNA polymerase sigma factor (sigma-70 family)
MKPDNLPPDLVDAFAETVLASATAEMPRKEVGLRLRIRSLGQYPEAIIRAQSNEALAHALKHSFFFAEASEEFYVRFEPLIQAWFVKWGLHYHHAFDLTQNLLWRCRRQRLRGYHRSHGKLTTYLKRAAFNLWIERLIRRRQPTLLAPTQFDGNESEGIDGQLDQELSDHVYQALPSLSAAQRAVVVSAMKGKSPDEIAQQLGFVFLRQPGLLTAPEIIDTDGLCWPPVALTWKSRGFLHAGHNDTVSNAAPVGEEGESTPSAIIETLALRVAAFFFDIG